MEFNQRHFKIQNWNKYCSIRPGERSEILSIFQLSSLALRTQSINLQLYNQKTCSRINWNGYLLFNKNFDCDLGRRFSLGGANQGELAGWCHPHRCAGLSTLLFGFDPWLRLTSNSNKSWEIQLLFKNFKVVLKHFQSLYMNGTNFSSSQHKVGVRQVC